MNPRRSWRSSRSASPSSLRRLLLIKSSQISTNRSKGPFESQNFRYLIPFDFTFQQFMQVIRKRLVLEKDQALTIFFQNNKLQQNEKLMSQIFQDCKDEDGFLYCKYASYEVYGATAAPAVAL